MMINNLNEVAFNLIQSQNSKQHFRMAVPRNILRQAFDIAAKYRNNNPIIYVMDCVKAKIIKTTQAEYDLLLNKDSARFGKPFKSRKDLINSYFNVLNGKVKFLVKNEINIKYTIQ